jgi:hypothetical protein
MVMLSMAGMIFTGSFQRLACGCPGKTVNRLPGIEISKFLLDKHRENH